MPETRATAVPAQPERTRRRHSAYPRSPVRASGAGVLAVLAAVLLTGCTQTSRMTTGSVTPAGTAAPATAPSPATASLIATDPQAAEKVYGSAYEKNPNDRGTGLAYASALQAAGRNEQSLAVMQQVAIKHPTDRDVLAAYGKALAAAGDLPKALETVRRAQTPDRPDWRLLSAEGAILDQLGRKDAARAQYRRALVIQPDEPSVLSNLGMSYLLANELPAAEEALSRAVKQPGADVRVRQNLALVVGLQGRFDEAERIASAVLSPEEAKGNVAYLRQMLGQKNTWSELRAERG
ncbi:tetratricopeptide repeat protein [Aureimonas sp. AU4]|uniref:tetratricopeptide repeat protein n=1 Tax=Aureimonas sp. AU4 TaxID=1638163 RepID=UPI001FCE019D|nr:tetratricopeptide repeat protein [Aureimonas sp. AU4]